MADTAENIRERLTIAVRPMPGGTHIEVTDLETNAIDAATYNTSPEVALCFEAIRLTDDAGWDKGLPISVHAFDIEGTTKKVSMTALGRVSEDHVL